MQLNSDWSTFLADELETPSFHQLQNFIKHEYKTAKIYPPYENVFSAFNLLPLEKVKVVIIGQDPYHGENQANGLAFSVGKSAKIPPSLKNIYKELMEDMGCDLPYDGNLESWAKEGVLLINSVLTVRKSEANSHRKKGWEEFTDAIIKQISQNFEHIVFILWGKPAHQKEKLVDVSKHLVIKSVHPSPLSAYRGFFGSKPFSQTNAYLKEHSLKPIKWCLPSQQTLL